MGSVKILRASAGSGKTYRLAYEYIRSVVTDPKSYSSILAVTFTNKATEEMKTRILAQLNLLATGDSPYLEPLTKATGLDPERISANATQARSYILHDYSHFAISTIDKFFQKIVRGFIKELGLDFNYTVELNNDSYLSEAVDRVIEKGSTDSTIATIERKARLSRQQDGRNWDISRELVAISKEILSERYHPSTQNPEELIARYESISKKVKVRKDALTKECESTLAVAASYGLQLSDFKGGERSSIIKIFVKMAEGGIVTNIERLHKAADSAEEWYAKTSGRRDDIIAATPQLMEQTRRVLDLYAEYETEQNSFDLLGENFYKNLLLGYIHKEAQAIWAERNRVPIHQTTALIRQIVENTPAPFIYEKVGTRFTRYMIDEFQDTSTGQWLNFLPLLDDAVASSDGESVMLIGDVKQAIYRWRGGDWDILANEASKYFGQYADQSEQLKMNWRSLPEVVNFNNNLIKSVVQTASNPILSRVYDDFEQTVPPRKTGGYVKVAQIYEDDFEQTILETVGDVINRGYRQKDIAVLVRTKIHGSEAAEILLRGGYSIIDHESLLLSNSESVSTIISLLKYTLNREDLVSLARYNRLAGNDFNTQYANPEFIDGLLLKTPLEALDTLIVELRLNHRADQVSYLQAFYQVVLDYSNESVPDLRGFVEWWDENGTKRSLYLPSTGDAITIITIHKSKGLQFPCVIIPRCDWQITPKTNSTLWSETTDEDYAIFNPAPINYKESMSASHYADKYAQERGYSLIDSVNMLYVALTRAERELYVYYAGKSKLDIKTGELKTTTPANSIYSLMQQSGFGNIEVGEQTSYEPEAEQPGNQIFFDKFAIEPSAQKIRTSWDTQRYYEDGGKIETPISRGVLMHQLFSQITTLDDLEPSIQRMVISGEMTQQMSTEVRSVIVESLKNPTIASWFSPHWKLYHETAIIQPQTSATRRPDRVMVNDKSEAVVVDYKFGKVQKKSYIAQVEDYVDLLRQMGYTQIKGYIWYVELGEVVQVGV